MGKYFPVGAAITAMIEQTPMNLDQLTALEQWIKELNVPFGVQVHSAPDTLLMKAQVVTANTIYMLTVTLEGIVIVGNVYPNVMEG